MSELEELARKGRAADGERQQGDDARRASQDDYRRYLTERLVAHTFRFVHGSRALPMVVIGGVFAAAAVVALIGDGASLGFILPVLILVGIAGGYWVNRLAERRAIHNGLAWIRNLPFDFDGKAYLDGLSEERMNTRVRLQLRFEDRPSDDDRQMFSDACAGAVELEDRRWKDRTLTLQSGQIGSYFPARGAKESYYSNALVHRWMVDLIDRAVRPIHARQPIARVSVEVE